jgi:hypothetical protein
VDCIDPDRGISWWKTSHATLDENNYIYEIKANFQAIIACIDYDKLMAILTYYLYIELFHNLNTSELFQFSYFNLPPASFPSCIVID